MLLMQKLVLIAPLITQAILYLLLALSVLSIGIIVERWWFFARRRENVERLADILKSNLETHDVAGARKALEGRRSVESRVLVEALGWYTKGPDSFEQILAKAIRTERKSVDSGLVFLGTLGNNAPFIGLFGTVLGIVTGFKELGANSTAAASGGGGMEGVMSAIAEALIATAIGILVAIPAVVAYNVFQKKAATIEDNANSLGNIVVASLKAVPFVTAANGAKAPHEKTAVDKAEKKSAAQGAAEAGA